MCGQVIWPRAAAAWLLPEVRHQQSPVSLSPAGLKPCLTRNFLGLGVRVFYFSPNVPGYSTFYGLTTVIRRCVFFHPQRKVWWNIVWRLNYSVSFWPPWPWEYSADWLEVGVRELALWRVRPEESKLETAWDTDWELPQSHTDKRTVFREL